MCIMGKKLRNTRIFLKSFGNCTGIHLAGAFLTMVLLNADIIPDIVTSGLPTVAVRVSAHPAMRGVAKAGKACSGAQRQQVWPHQSTRLRGKGAGRQH